MKFRRILTPAVLIVMMLVQFVPGTFFGPRPAAALASCDMAQFIADVTVPDGTSFSPGAAFTKTWRIKNVSSCTWTTAYSMIFVSGDPMGAPASVSFPASVAPGATVDLSVNLTAPSAAGHYRGYFKLKDDTALVFGVGPAGHPEYNWTFFVDINVGTTFSTAYDFVATFCSAAWSSGAGTLPCPGSASANGYVQSLTSPQLETGASSIDPGLLVSPQAVTGGFIQGTFPAFTVQAGDRFQSIVNCAAGAAACYVNFQLRYQIGSGPIQTFWTFKERYDGLFFRVNLDLSSLAGQSVAFSLYVADIPGRGVPTGDQALWAGPKIVRGGGGGSGTTPGPIPTILPSSACDRALFLSDVTIPDGTAIAASTPFVKTWLLKNNGTCTWTTGYALIFASGDPMGAPAVINLPTAVAPGAQINLSVTMTAPTIAGHYRGYWRLRNATGTPFGVGTGGAYPFWVDINVTGSYTTAYDFAAHACDATWSSGAGVLPCYGTDGDSRGFVLGLAAPQLEDGTTGVPGMLTFPQNVTDGYIQGQYPAFNVLSGDHFQAVISCQFGVACDVNFRLDYQIGSGTVTTLRLGHETNTGTVTRWDVDLSSLAGQSVKFILRVDANGLPTNDRAIWDPRIARLVTAPPPGPTPTTGPGADLKVTISDGVTSYVAGSTLTYTVIVTNNGPLNVTGAIFNDALPAQITAWTVTCVPDPGALCTAGPVSPVGAITDAVNIPAGKKVTYSITATVSASATGVLSNSVQITPPDGVPDSVPANNTATDNDNPPYADLAITSLTDGVSLYNPAAAAPQLTYTVVVFNSGPSDVVGAQFTEVVPPLAQLISLDMSCVPDPGATCTAGPLTIVGGSVPVNDLVNIPAGKKITYTITFTLQPSATGALTEQAQVALLAGGTTPLGVTDPNPSNNTASDTDLPPSSDLMVTLTDNSTTFTPGGTNTFVAVVTNNGPSDVSLAQFTINKPVQVNTTWTVVCTPDLGASCSPLATATSISDLAVTIPAGKKITYTITMPIFNPTTGPMTVTAYIATPASLPDPVPGNNTASDTDNISP